MGSNTSNLIKMLTEAMDEISIAKDKYEINHIIESLLIKFTNSDTANLFLYDLDNQRLYLKKKDTSPIPMNSPEGLLGNAFLSKKPSVNNYPISDKYYVADVDNSENIKLKCQIIVPILDHDELIGIIRVSRDIYHNKQYTKKDIELIHSLHTFIVKIIHILCTTEQVNYKTDLDTSIITEKLARENDKSIDVSDSNKSLILLSNSVHDIRTPANTLFGFLELLEDEVDDIRLKKFIKNAKESAGFINTLTDNILDEAKESYIADKPTLATVSSIKIFSQIANMFTANMLDKHLSYIIYIDPSIPKEITIDDHKLKRVITNLIGNAYKFTPKGKCIDFSVKYDAEMCVLKISVSDNGIGIEKKKQLKIFNTFAQADEGVHSTFGGTGLGLSISSQYVADLGGKLKLKSALGKGSKFYFSLPVVVTNPLPSYEKFKNVDKKITLLTNYPDSYTIQNIINYLIALGMPAEKIVVNNRLENDTTHLFCFEHKLSVEVLNTVKTYKMKLLVIEKELFSLSKKLGQSSINVISENTYYGDMIHSTVFSKNKKRILIADDNKINITLLKYMLETDYVVITSAVDGESALELLKKSQQDTNRFDIVFLDKHMPILSGTQVLESLRSFEKEHNLKPIFAISITGEPKLGEYEKDLYDLMIRKPFNKQRVRDAIVQAK